MSAPAHPAIPGLTVVKLGGNILEEKALRERALAAVAARWTSGRKVVVVHGGGKRIDASLQALKIPKKTYRGLRITDPETLDVVVQAIERLHGGERRVGAVTHIQELAERLPARIEIRCTNGRTTVAVG